MQLTVIELSALAKKAGVDYRTLLRFIAGLPVQPKKRALIDAALTAGPATP